MLASEVRINTENTTVYSDDTRLFTSQMQANNNLGMGHIQAFSGLTVVYEANQSTFATLQFSERNQSAEVLPSCPPISQLNQSNVDECDGYEHQQFCWG